MKLIISILIFSQLLFSCSTVKNNYEYTFNITDSVISKNDLDKAINTLTKRLDLLGIGNSKITATNKELIIQSSNIDESLIDRYLLNKSELVFYETYTILDVANALKTADANIAAYVKAESDTQISNPLFLLINPAMPFQDNAGKYIYSSNIGMVQKKDISLLKKYLTITKNDFPVDMQLLLGTEIQNEQQKGSIYYNIYFVKNNQTKFLANDNVIEAEAGMDQSERPSLRFKFDTYGSKVWQRMTTANVGKAIAITLNNKVLTAPNVYSAIEGGNCEISGSFTVEETQDLAISLKAGYLPLNLSLVKVRVLK